MEGRHALRGNGPAGSALEIMDVEAGESRERQFAAIRGNRRRLQQTRLDRAEAQPIGEVEARPQAHLYLRLERNFGDFPSRQRHPANAAASREQHRLAIRREGVAGQQIPRVAGFLLIPLHGMDQPFVPASGQVAQAQAGLLLVAGAVCQLAAVRGERRAQGAALGLDEDVLHVLPQIQTGDLPLGEAQVVAEPAILAGIVEIAPVRRIDRPQSVGAPLHGGGWAVAGRQGQLHALAAIQMIGPELEGAQAPGAFRHHDMLAVRGPGRGGEIPPLAAAADLLRLAAIRVDHPKLGLPAPIRHEGDAFARRGEARLAVVGHAPGDGLGLAPFDGQQVEVAQDFQHQLIAGRRNIQRKPSGPLHREGDLALGFQGQLILLGWPLGRQQGRGQQEGQRRGQRPSPTHAAAGRQAPCPHCKASSTLRG